MGGVNEEVLIPEKYNKSDFNTFNETFEVGIAKFFAGDNIDPDDLVFCKDLVVTWKDNIKGSAYNQLYAQLKYPPLKISYDKSFFNKFDSRGAYITSDLRVELIFPENFGSINRFECLYGSDSLIWHLGTAFMALDRLPIYKEVNVSNGGVDTVWGLRHSDLYRHSNALGTPCPYPVITNDDFSNYNITVAIIDGIIHIDNQGNQEIHSLSLFSLSGALIDHLSNKIVVGQSVEINLNISSPPGFYLLQAQLNSGTQISQKLIFIL